MSFKKPFLTKKGEGYIDVIVSVWILSMLLALALHVFQFFTVKQDMDFFAREMAKAAAAYGEIRDGTDKRYGELVEETGLSPDSCTWTADYFNEARKRVQLGDPIKVKLTYRTHVQGFGVFQIPVTLTAEYSTVSEKYWK